MSTVLIQPVLTSIMELDDRVLELVYQTLASLCVTSVDGSRARASARRGEVTRHTEPRLA